MRSLAHSMQPKRRSEKETVGFLVFSKKHLQPTLSLCLGHLGSVVFLFLLAVSSCRLTFRPSWFLNSAQGHSHGPRPPDRFSEHFVHSWVKRHHKRVFVLSEATGNTIQGTAVSGNGASHTSTKQSSLAINRFSQGLNHHGECTQAMI